MPTRKAAHSFCVKEVACASQCWVRYQLICWRLDTNAIRNQAGGTVEWGQGEYRKLGDHTSIAISASSRMHISALSRMRHWIWLSVAPRLCGRWCHALMVSRERSSAPRGSRTRQVSGKTFLLFCTSHVTSGSGLDSIPMKHRRSVLFGSTLTVLCSILPDLSRWVRNSISLQICPVF